ncbi:hypothetical protein RDWZM_009536 [Blomia tropicalis]|uniref:Uncharacterized protein n=1 Tax=Blomia tropicalis TaxID=40697 RepID=A0A9Q0RL41_BLOTA|nr:hypothetical protein RDWZM_009536 [Blomia tropicalis]
MAGNNRKDNDTIDRSINNDLESKTSKSEKSIDEQLKDSLNAQQRRRMEMLKQGTNSLGRMVRSVTTNTNHNGLRLFIICIAMICILFSSIIMMIVDPNPPYYDGAQYQHNDLMRLVTLIHEKSIDITPNLSRSTLEQEVRNSSSNNDEENNQDWLNYFVNVAWPLFLARKEFKSNKTNINRTDLNGTTSPKSFSETSHEIFQRIKQFFQGKQLKHLKRSWFDEPPKRPWDRPSIMAIWSLITFICLTVFYLASTELSSTTTTTTTKRLSEPKNVSIKSNHVVQFQSPDPSKSEKNEKIFIVSDESKKVIPSKINNFGNPFESEDDDDDEDKIAKDCLCKKIQSTMKQRKRLNEFNHHQL